MYLNTEQFQTTAIELVRKIEYDKFIIETYNFQYVYSRYVLIIKGNRYIRTRSSFMF